MRVVSLFAGCGGLDLGLVNSGHKIVYAQDIDKDCVKTYNSNFDHECIEEDVKKLESKLLPEYDLLTGGFPCQGFSVANKYRSVEDKRNELYLEIVRILKESQPKFFLAENVMGILSLGGGEVLKTIVNEFGETGYSVKVHKVNAYNYGTPQSRKRVLFFGVHKSLEGVLIDKLHSLFPPSPTHELEATLITKKALTLRDALKGLDEPGEKSKFLNHVTNNHKVKINGYIGNRILDWDKPGPTIVGRGGGTGGPVIPVHPNLKRRFSVREVARIQSFPDNFLFEGSISSQFRQIGNAVPVQLAYNLGLALSKIEKISSKELTNKTS